MIISKSISFLHSKIPNDTSSYSVYCFPSILEILIKKHKFTLKEIFNLISLSCTRSKFKSFIFIHSLQHSFTRFNIHLRYLIFEFRFHVPRASAIFARAKFFNYYNNWNPFVRIEWNKISKKTLEWTLLALKMYRKIEIQGKFQFLCVFFLLFHKDDARIMDLGKKIISF